MCFSTVEPEMYRLSEIAVLDLPWAMAASTSFSRSVRVLSSRPGVLLGLFNSSSTTIGSMTDYPSTTSRRARSSSSRSATRSLRR
jgi:hypothetical protein